MDKNVPKVSPEKMHLRKPFQKPELKKFGDVRLLTRMSGGSFIGEGASGRRAKK